VVVGPRGAAKGLVELTNRATGEKQEISADAALKKFIPAKAA
jgi:prolyl-tRNA synthetase